MRSSKVVQFFLFALVLLPGAACAFCFDEAAARYNLDPNLLRAIAKVESGYNPVALNRNANGSEDIGVMQINSTWLSNLHRFGITRASLFDSCTNVHVGAWVLAGNVRRHGHTWKAVGAYNAASTHKQSDYVRKVWTVWQHLGQNVTNRTKG